MWLLDTKTITISQQSADDFDYAILSHRWGKENEEVSFADIQRSKFIRHKKGYQKIKRFCKQARKDGYKYAWVDTCCIDKSSSAELQEAINSMYRWYERAAVCYAYLQDVPSVEITNSEWFTRGWTLQELLAPKSVQFFDKDWNSLGDRWDLVDILQKATGIRGDVLTRFINLHDCSIAERMSWAAHRKTKRVEDRAYSLFGIFQVHLPMLYGEGEAAFQRLQHAMLRTSEDDTLFAWKGISDSYGGLLAPNLEAFKHSAVLRTRVGGPYLQVFGSQNTERGIGIRTKLIPWSTNTYLVLLGCRHTGHTADGFGIYLRELDEANHFARVAISGDDLLHLSTKDLHRLQVLGRQNVLTPYKQDHPKSWAAERSIIIRQLPLSWKHELSLKKQVYGFRLDMPAESFSPYSVQIPEGIDRAVSMHNTVSTLWSGKRKTMSAHNGSFLNKGIIGSLCGLYHPVTREKISEIRDIYIGFDHLFNPVFYIRKKPTAQSNISIDAFLSEKDEAEQDTSHGSQFNNGSMLPQNEKSSALEEAQFWNNLDAHTIVDNADRDFCAIKTDRKADSEIYSYWLSGTKTRLNFRLRRYEMQEGMVWDLSLPANLNVLEYRPGAGPEFPFYIEYSSGGGVTK